MTRKAQFLALALLSIAARQAHSETRLVPGDYATIQQAIEACNNADVVIVEPGTYFENINFLGKDIIVTGTEPNDPEIVAATIINGSAAGSVVTFERGETPEAVLTGFTITNGFGTVNESFEPQVVWGAGIYCSNASPTIKANVLVNNHGPVETEGNELVLAGYGGAIGCIESSAVITQNVIKDNSAFAGAGIIAYLGDPAISSNLIYGNSAWVGGGAALLNGGRLINNTIVANDASLPVLGDEAGQGGNIYASSDPESRCMLVNNIICSAKSGGGILSAGLEEDLGAFNNVWNNSPSNYASHDPQTGQLVYDGPADRTGQNGNISEDPLFVEPQSNDYHLQSDSPCISAGDPDFAAEPNETDIDGDPRIYAVRADIGADEYTGYVKPVADAGPDQRVAELQLITLDGSGSFIYDPCAVTTFKWNQLAGPPVVLSDSAAMQPTFMPESEDEYQFELTVGDGTDTSGPDEVVIIVGNRPPVADAGRNMVCPVPSRVTLDGTGSYDPDPIGELTYTWTQLEGPPVVLEYADTGTPFFDCSEAGLYVFELLVNDGFTDSRPSAIQVATIAVTIDQQDLYVGYSTDHYFHYPDVSGDVVVYGVGGACDYTWKPKCKDMETGEVGSFSAHGTDVQPKIDGDIVVWFGVERGFGNPWYHEPSNSSVFVRNMVSGVQKTLRQYTWSESYSHPVVSGNKAVWLEHLNLDPDPSGNEANNWWNTPYSICGADITDLGNPVYFTIAENVARRDPYPCHSYSSDFDDVIDISGDIVVYEAGGDIYGADISDINDVRVFTICSDSARQFDPAISGNIVLWTDERNDGGDIYGADISDPENIEEFQIVKQAGIQQQPAIDGCMIVYVNGDLLGEIKACHLTKQYGAGLDIPISGSAYGGGPSIDGDIIVWQNDYYGQARGISLDVAYSVVDGPVKNLTTGSSYEYIQHAIAGASAGDRIAVSEGVYPENIDFKGKSLTVSSTDPNDPAVVAATVICGNQPVTFSGGEDANCVLSGFTITGADTGIYCSGACPTITDCRIVWNSGAGIKLYDGSGPTISRCGVIANADSGIEMQSRKTPRVTIRNHPTIANSVIAANGRHGVSGGTPKLTNCTIVDNLESGIDSYKATVTNSIVYYNGTGSDTAQITVNPGTVTYSNVQSSWPGPGNIDADPCFASRCLWADTGDPNVTAGPDTLDVTLIEGDYHLKSEGWRWSQDRGLWSWDEVTSGCIDAGNPGSALGQEPLCLADDPENKWGQNLRINMGAYGGTGQASIGPHACTLLADLNNDGTVDSSDLADWTENWLSNDGDCPADLDRNRIVDAADFALLAHCWLKKTTTNSK